MNCTLTVLTVPAKHPDDIDGMSFADRRSNGIGWTRIEVLRRASSSRTSDPDVVARRALEVDLWVYGSPDASDPDDDDCTVATALVTAESIAHAASLLAPFLADPRALAQRLIDDVGSNEDPAHVARVLALPNPWPARGPAEEAAAFLRIFQSYVASALERRMGIAWEIRTYREERPVVVLKDIHLRGGWHGWAPLRPDKATDRVQWFKNGDDVLRLVQNADSVTLSLGQAAARQELEVITLLAVRDVNAWVDQACAAANAARASARFAPAETDRAFLEAIVAAPDDDAPRLVWADVLLERGDPRGEMIAGQCRLDRLDVNDAERASLLPRVLQLVALHGRKWADKRGRIFARGFVDSAEVRWSDFAEEADALFAITPPLRELRFRSLRNDLVDYPWSVFEDARFERLSALDLSDPFFYHDNPRDPATLLAYPFGPDLIARLDGKLPRLRELTMRKSGLAEESLALLGARAGLTTLDLAHTPLRGLGAVLFGGKGLAELRTLNLGHCDLADADLVLLPRLGKLEELDLGANALGLATTQLLGGLRIRGLRLSGTTLGDEGARALAAAPELVGLELSASNVGNTGLAALARLPLASLSVADNPFDEDGVEAFLRGPIARSIKRLALGRRTPLKPGEFRELGPRLAKVLARVELPELWDLDLRSSMLDGSDLAALLDALPSLRVLRLGECGIGDDGFARLVAHPRFSELETLTLDHNALGPHAATLLARAPRLPLRLELGNNALGDDGVRMLVTAPAVERVTHLELGANGLSNDAVATILSEASRVGSLAALSLVHNPAIKEPAHRACDDVFGPRVTHDGPRVTA